ncbi:MAG TPA: transketolase, partial [Clostridiales bacterium]|nr:transketolase [Clostridiales bacterium]
VEAAETLKKEGIKVTVINVHTLKPLDKETVRKYALKSRKVITAEEHSVIGGLGDAVADALIGEQMKFRKVGINDRFGQSGLPDDMMEDYGLTAHYLADHVKALL